MRNSGGGCNTARRANHMMVSEVVRGSKHTATGKGLSPSFATEHVPVMVT